jgi:hypothetical protein
VSNYPPPEGWVWVDLGGVEELVRAEAAVGLVPPLPTDIERCPRHKNELEYRCPQCVVARAQIERYGRARAVTLERQATASPDAWLPVDLSEAPELPEPTMMTAEPWEGGEHGASLLRAGAIASAFGKTGTGKTTLSYLTGVQEIRKDNLLLVIDHEMGQALAKDALLALGLSLAEIRDGVLFFDDPEAMSDLYFARLMEALIEKEDRTRRPLSLGVYDSLSRAMGKVAGVSTNDEVHVNAWYDSLPRRVRKERPIAAHLIVDHPGRTDGPEAIGSHAKGAGPDVLFHVVEDVMFEHERGRGRSPIVLTKARAYRHLRLKTEVAELVVVATIARLRLLRLAEDRGDEVDVPLDKQKASPAARRERISLLLIGAGVQGALTKVLTGGEGGDAVPLRHELYAMVADGLVRWLREPGTSKGRRFWLAAHAPEGACSDRPPRE